MSRIELDNTTIVPETRPPAGLKRGMKMLGVLLITLSAVSPASSVFIIVPGILATSGSGALLSMLLGAAVGIFMSLVYAELASAYPLSGGEYAIVGRVIGPLAGFIILGVNLVGGVLIPAVFALGVSSYLTVIDPSIPAVPTAIATIVLTTILGIFSIKTNAFVTGIFLLMEILALIVVTALGFLHVSRPLTEIVLHPVMLDGASLISAPISMIGMATSVAIFAYNGYGSAVYFGEETPDARRHIARAILWALAITVVSELLPVTAALMGAPDLAALLGSANIFGDFIAARGGNALGAVISLGIALAIFNAVIACILTVARFMYSTGRDNVWPAPINRALTLTHSRFNSPWVATVVCGVLASLACLVDENVLLVLTGAGIILVYVALCLAVMAGQ
jgi:amino acid transporter